MKTTVLFLCCMLSILLVAGCSKKEAGDGPTHARKQLNGEQLYSRKCAACHGPEGKGDGPIGAGFSHVADLSSDAVQKLSDAKLKTIMTDGAGAMPPVHNLNDQELALLVQEVRQFGGQTPGDTVGGKAAEEQRDNAQKEDKALDDAAQEDAQQ